MIRKSIRKKKTFSMAKAVMCAMLMAVSFSGCGGSSSGTGQTAPAQAGETDDADVSEEGAETTKTGDDNAADTAKDSTSDIQDNHMIPKISLRSNHYYENNEDYVFLYEAQYDELILSDETKSLYPELASAIDLYNEEKRQAVLSGQDLMVESAKEHLVDSPDTFSTYENTNTLFLRRVDSEVLSLLQYNYSYEGGIHGYYGHDGTTFDVRTGEKIELDDVVNDRAALADYVTARVKEWYPELEPVVGTMEETIREYFNGQGEYDVAWVMEPYGVTFFFSPYLLGSYADGEQQVSVSFSEKPELFTERFHEREGAWGYRFEEYQPQHMDLDGDGKMDEVEVRGVVDENSYEYGDTYYKGVEILINGNSYEGELYGYKVLPTLVRNSEGNYYVYVESPQDNDWQGLYLFDMNGEKPFKISETSGEITCEAPEYSYEEGSYSETGAQLYNPEHFYIGTRMQTLSTYNGTRPYKVGAAGMTEPLLPWFTASSDGIVLTSKMDLELDVIDENTGETLESGVSFAVGTEFTICRTDDESYVDCRVSDGRLVRVPVESAEWPQTINGIDIEDVFDGIIFVG